MGVWNSSRHTVQEMTPVLRARSLEREGTVGEYRGLCLWVTLPLTGKAQCRMEDGGSREHPWTAGGGGGPVSQDPWPPLTF